jgi:hypothetical protein
VTQLCLRPSGTCSPILVNSSVGQDHTKRSSGEPGPGVGPLTLLELLSNLAVHNADHLGRIVQLRQMFGCWPPPDGGDTW